MMCRQLLNGGGKNRHPTPPEYFIASLSSCIAAFVVQYCNHSGLNTSGMLVEITYEKATQPSHIKDIVVNISLPNVELGERVEVIKRVSRHCTIHETISRMGTGTGTDTMQINVKDKTYGTNT
jgi:uncharacterized OsmC-like protein